MEVVFIFITFRFGVVTMSCGGAFINSVEKSTVSREQPRKRWGTGVMKAIEEKEDKQFFFALILYLYITIFHGNCFCHHHPSTYIPSSLSLNRQCLYVAAHPKSSCLKIKRTGRNMQAVL